MFFLQFISQFIKVLRAGATPGQIAGGFALGFMIGLMPFLTLQGIGLMLILFFLNVNLAAASFAIFVSSFVAFLFDPLFHNLGFYVLTGVPALHSLWTALYNMPVAPLSRFNNTVVMGSFVSGLVLALPVFLLIRKGVISYRAGLEEKIKRWKIVRWITGSKLATWYFNIRDLGE
jgi:uncharacterized protein (TIGR03546 family)